jgi:arsenite methyltransferase
MARHSNLYRANFRSYRLGFSLLILLLGAGCARLKQCAYEGFSRDEWQQPKRVIESLQIRPGDHVADLGAGSGYFTFALSKAVGPEGKIYAVDIDRDMTDLLAKRAKEEGANNVDVILVKPEDPLLPAAGVDLILSVDAYHHISNRVNYFSNLRKYLRADGRVGIVEFDRRAWFAGLWNHYTPSEFIKREMEQAGYVLQREFDFLDRQSFLIFVLKNPNAKSAQAGPVTRLLKLSA